MKRNILISVCLCFYIGIFAQGKMKADKSTPEKYAEMIKPKDLKRHLTILASDDFEGRETGTPGNKKAAEYIAGQFRKHGLKPVGTNDSYMQPIEFSYSSWDRANVYVNGAPFKLLWDFVAFPQRFRTTLDSARTDKVFFLGYGIDDPEYTDYGKGYYKGSDIMIYEGEPFDEDGISQITGTNERSAWGEDMTLKLNAAYKKGVRMVFIISDNIQTRIGLSRRQLLGRGLELNAPGDRGLPTANHIYISPAMAEAIMGKQSGKVIKMRDRMRKKGKSKKVKLKTDVMMDLVYSIERFESSNVVGLLEGIDPELEDEYVVVTGHYDHLGKRGNQIYNGADDNGSGTCTILELVESFAAAKKAKMAPQRSILFMLVTGEEKGLLGSKFYTDNPIFPLDQTIANVNIDMVGRVDAKHEENPNYIYVIGSDKLSSQLHEINETANATYTGLELDYTYNDEDDPNRYYYRSDHYNFVKKGIPAIFYFSGTHSDYHRPSDTVDKILFDKLALVGKLIFHTTWELSTREERIVVDVEQSGSR